MREIRYFEALREAIREEMLRNEKVFVIGEDVELGYAFAVTRGLKDEFGVERIRDTPISENTIVGAALGSALNGMRPIVEIMFADLLPLCMDQIVNQAAKIRYWSGGQIKVPLVIRTPGGWWGSFGPVHSQSLESWFTNVPGLKVVVPSTPYDAKGLLKTAIRDDNPVLFFEHKQLYKMSGPVPQEEYTIRFGEADVKRGGKDVTIVATLFMVHKALGAAEKLEKEGISVEVVDPRTLVPFDSQSVLDSVKKTGRLVIATEGNKTCGVGAEILSIVVEEAFDYLDAPIKRVASLSTPVPFSPPLEKHVIPDENKIIQAVKEVVA